MVTNYVTELVKGLSREKAELLTANAANQQNAFNDMANGYVIPMEIRGLFSDLSIAEKVKGQEGIKAVYDEVVERFKDDYKMITELAVCLNWKIWQLYKQDEETARCYDKLWSQVGNFFYTTFKGNKEAERYYFEVTD